MIPVANFYNFERRRSGSMSMALRQRNSRAELALDDTSLAKTPAKDRRTRSGSYTPGSSPSNQENIVSVDEPAPREERKRLGAAQRCSRVVPALYCDEADCASPEASHDPTIACVQRSEVRMLGHNQGLTLFCLPFPTFVNPNLLALSRAGPVSKDERSGLVKGVSFAAQGGFDAAAEHSIERC
jgi:hypothetical protein